MKGSCGSASFALSIFCSQFEDQNLDAGVVLFSIAMVTFTEGSESGGGQGLVSQFSKELGLYVHWDLAVHRGHETCSRISLEQVSIMQGAALYKELSENCTRCAIKRKKFIEAAFGPIRETQLALAPPFWFCQMDMFGPVDVFVPGFERET